MARPKQTKRGQSKKESPPSKDVESSVSEEETPAQETQPKKRTKTKPTVESHLKKYDELLDLLAAEIEKKQSKSEPGVRVLKRVSKELNVMRKQVPRICKTRGYPNKNSNRVSGFTLPCEISPELRKFLKLKNGDSVTRRDVTNALCVYVNLKDGEQRESMLKWAHLNSNGRDLRDEEYKMRIVPDKALANLLNYSQYRKDVKAGKILKERTDEEGQSVMEAETDDSLYFRTIQKLIQSHIRKTSSN